MTDEVSLRIEKLVYGGEGLGRLDDGRVVFVSGVLPGEEARVRIVRKRKGVYQAVPTEIITSSPDRITPPCGAEPQCTGATWPHIAYAAQLRLKQEILLDTVRRTGGMEPRAPLTIIPSPRRDHYRLRTQFTVQPGPSGQRIGFFRQGTYDLIEVADAFLLDPAINDALAGIRSTIASLPPLREVHINASPAGEAHVLLFFDPQSTPSLDAWFGELRRIAPGVVGVTGYAGCMKTISLGRNYLSLAVEGLTLHATEGNFFQVNWDQNRQMVRTVLDLAGLTGGETVLDLYCGIGNFALPLARQAKKVTGIESGYSSVEDAQRNAARNGIANAEFIADNLEKGLKTLLARKMRADVIVLDPPRSGATLKTLERVLAFVPKKIVYVSCNPSTLARDLKYFHLFGFRLNRLQPIDMFPYTYHIECVAEMVRS